MAGRRNKKGSVTVFVLMFFMTLVSLVMVFVDQAKKDAVRGTARELGLLWCDSVLGEYDRHLQERYDLFGFYGMPEDISKKLDFYADQSYSEKEYIDYEGASCALYDYSLGSTENFRRQVVRTGKLDAAGRLLHRGKKSKKGETGKNGKDGSGGKGASGKGGTKSAVASGKGGTSSGAGNSNTSGGNGAKLTGSAALADLPSAGSPSSISVDQLKSLAKGLGSIKDLAKTGTDQAFEDQYIRTHYRSWLESPDQESHYFTGEMEYLICGKPSDQQNLRGVRLRITAVREGMNMAFLMKDPRRSAETMAAAQILTPGPAAAATQKLLQAAWALAESNNDYNLLMNGKKVPFVKTDASWAVDLESIITGGLPKEKPGRERKSGDGGKGSDSGKGRSSGKKKDAGENKMPKLKTLEYSCIDPGNSAGDTYDDYLQGFLFLMDEEVKLLRMMDLIQVNMQYAYDGSFRIRDYNTGLKAVWKIDGRSYAVEREYQPA